MMDALHLLWIIPMSVLLGYSLCAIMVVAKESDQHSATIQYREEEM